MTQPLLDALLDARALLARGAVDGAPWSDGDEGLLEIDRLITVSRATGRVPAEADALFAAGGPFETLADRYGEAVARLSYLTGMLQRLRHASDLRHALAPPTGSGVAAHVWAHGCVLLGLDPPASVRTLAAAWGIVRPFAVLTDAEEERWRLFAGAEDLPGRRLAVDRVSAGPWYVEARLREPPSGSSWGIAVGNMPACDLLEHDAEVGVIEVCPLRR